ncbi:tetratricopeptide repeat protein [Paenibacillus sp. J2TS4]|uniref:tetratricopeptide repeat protein n=1 Tax=Paenibacillus sp. J2TS4 TaxID=2807194 RepID=UPI001B17E361|nr:tetratricopeptide repeat protein [Paenibacillus sp. J2TS4]GIP32418.1 hypothetical protein J2TS4_16280 [Paenibacillus sp. J2TS4]
MNGHKAMQKAYESILAHDFNQAIAWFEQAVAAAPDHAEYHYRLSISCMRSSRFAQAAIHAAKAAELDPNNEAYRSHLERLQAKENVEKAQNLLEEGREKAYLSILLLKQAVNLDPLSKEAYLLLAMAYADIQDFCSALEAVTEALKLDPSNPSGMELKKEYEQQLHQYLKKSWTLKKGKGEINE